MKTPFYAATFLAFTSSLALAQGMAGQHFVENWDLNADGVVTLEEAKERRADIFIMFDKDENMALSADEYKLFDETREQDAQQNAVGHGQGSMKRAMEGMSQSYNDVNGDGVVSKDEFVSQTSGWLAMIDSNGDGVISLEDFGQAR